MFDELEVRPAGQIRQPPRHAARVIVVDRELYPVVRGGAIVEMQH
jgi:hypothetical protein